MENLGLVELKQEELREVDGGCMLCPYYYVKEAVQDFAKGFSSTYSSGYDAGTENWENFNNYIK